MYKWHDFVRMKRIIIRRVDATQKTNIPTLTVTDSDSSDVNVTAPSICLSTCFHSKLSIKWPLTFCMSWAEQGLTSHQTHYRSYWGWVFTGQMTQPTVSQHWRTMQYMLWPCVCLSITNRCSIKKARWIELIFCMEAGFLPPIPHCAGNFTTACWARWVVLSVSQ